jgi:hypothetical protein
MMQMLSRGKAVILLMALSAYLLSIGASAGHAHLSDHSSRHAAESCPICHLCQCKLLAPGIPIAVPSIDFIESVRQIHNPMPADIAYRRVQKSRAPPAGLLCAPSYSYIET